MIKPTVGRVVLYVPKEEKYSFGHCLHAGKRHAALVTAVHGDRCVNLAVFDVYGKTFPATSVSLRQPEDVVPQFGDYCEWMEYQIKTAAKAEEPQEAPAVGKQMTFREALAGAPAPRRRPIRDRLAARLVEDAVANGADRAKAEEVVGDLATEWPLIDWLVSGGWEKLLAAVLKLIALIG
jgi:hypothetical protein